MSIEVVREYFRPLGLEEKILEIQQSARKELKIILKVGIIVNYLKNLKKHI